MILKLSQSFFSVVNWIVNLWMKFKANLDLFHGRKLFHGRPSFKSYRNNFF